MYHLSTVSKRIQIPRTGEALLSPSARGPVIAKVTDKCINMHCILFLTNKDEKKSSIGLHLLQTKSFITAGINRLKSPQSYSKNKNTIKHLSE